MSNKTNDEKLRILQERLTEIRKKKEQSEIHKEQKTKESISNTYNAENLQEERTHISLNWLKYFIIVFCIAFGGYYTYNNLNLLNKAETNNTKSEQVETPLKYNLELNGDNIVITATFENEESSKLMVEDLKLKGFNAGYFFLPNKSNSTEKVYKVFIGPYEHIEETNQWIKNLDGEIEIIRL